MTDVICGGGYFLWGSSRTDRHFTDLLKERPNDPKISVYAAVLFCFFFLAVSCQRTAVNPAHREEMKMTPYSAYWPAAKWAPVPMSYFNTKLHITNKNLNKTQNILKAAVQCLKDL